MNGREIRTKERLDLIIRDLRDVSYTIMKVTIRRSVLKEENGRNSKAKVEGKLSLLLRNLMRVIHQKYWLCHTTMLKMSNSWTDDSHFIYV